MGQTATIIEICTKSDVPEGGVIKVEADGHEYAVYQVDGEYFVTNDACTHGPGSLSEGILEGHVIECDFHNGCFDIRNGEVVAPPCLVPLRTYVVLPHATAVIIEFPAE